MKPTKKIQKLVLRRETVLVLTPHQLGQVVGASIQCTPSFDDPCPAAVKVGVPN